MLYFSIQHGFHFEPTHDSHPIDSKHFNVVSIYKYDRPIEFKIVNTDFNFQRLYESYFNSFQHTKIDYQIQSSSFYLDQYYIQEIKAYDPSRPYLNVYTLYKFKYIYPMESIVIQS
jgi:hypothetical protein